MKNIQRNEKVRNIAIIAHVDHGKTTLVDHMLRQSGIFRENQDVSERIMDNMDLEKERGVTISAKNCAAMWNDVRINILDTPGHADFGGEVERAIKMVDGAVLLVDAAEGPLPQTRFVLQKALESGLKIIVLINKIDRKDARPKEVLDSVYELFMDLDAKNHQIDFPVIYSIGKEGIAQKSLTSKEKDLSVLFQTIIEKIPGPTYNPDEPFQMLVCDLDYSDYVGRLAVGRVFNGHVSKNNNLVCIKDNGAQLPLKTTKLQVYDGISIKEVTEASAGDIIILAGIEDVSIGDTICNKENPKALKRIEIDEPTISMMFTINSSPLAGTEGNIVQSRRILERLRKESLQNVAIQVEEIQGSDTYTVKGRGEFQMEILIEMMRREDFELSVGRPRVIFKNKNGQILEPIEHLFIDCDEENIGIIIEKLSNRKGKMINMVNHGTGRVRIEFTAPTRAIIGYRSEFLTDTRGTGIMNSYVQDYEEYRGDFSLRATGSLISDRFGKATPYAIYNLEPRGIIFISPNDPVYEGMIIGENNRDADINVNPCKEKKLSNMRAAGKDDNIVLTPVQPMTLERAITFIKDDELIEVTPKSIRLRKAILSVSERNRHNSGRNGD
ncbi:MAG: GTP-binding protein TypA/BipA [Elusimicrobia bacterium ADurb.Bin231]|nr:MAG: GTP-binding protein TypA/BipA [Elusimicrobia bacterium ADurb.Bin231]